MILKSHIVFKHYEVLTLQIHFLKKLCVINVIKLMSLLITNLQVCQLAEYSKEMVQ